jgi:CheY-like chemotaxis protein
MLRVDVEDRGIGISPEAQQRLFAPFHQVDASTTRKYGGTGLGLAICRRLVALMGGELGVTSAPGVGSTFWFTCPLRPAASVAGAQSDQMLPLAPACDGRGQSDDGRGAGAPMSPPTNQENPRSALLPAPYPAGRENGHGAVPLGLRVLVAEDESINLMLITALLQRAGCTVMTARNGIEAVAAAAEWSPDLILMDYHMPMMDGLQATRAIRDAERASQGPRVPIVALTANATAEARQAALAAGMDRFLTKPIVSLALQRCLEACTPRPRRTAAEGAPAP